MKLLFTTIFLLSTSLCFAQEAQNLEIFYLKFSGKYISSNQKDSADFIRVVSAPDSGSKLYNISEFYTGGQKKLIGTSITLDPPNIEGQCITFYKNGKRRSSEHYINGKYAGRQFYFYPNGKIYITKDYPDSIITPNPYGQHYKISENYDSLGVARVLNGNGYTKLYNGNFKTVEEEGKVKNGERDSIWKGYTDVVKGNFTETYQNGTLITGTATFADGTITEYKERETHPQFKGGLKRFGTYLSNHINYPDYERQKNIQGRVIIAFVVEKDGHITDVKVNRSVSPGLDEEALRVVSRSPNWIPGIYFGRPARVAYSVPIAFSLTK